MSAYMVDDPTINRILASIKMSKEHKDGFPWLRRDLDEIFSIDPEILGENLVRMNADAIMARYGADEYYQFEYEEMWITNRFQALKSLRCYLYQCSEGDVPEQRLYKAIDQYAADLALEIVMDMPEYNRAE